MISGVQASRMFVILGSGGGEGRTRARTRVGNENGTQREFWELAEQ